MSELRLNLYLSSFLIPGPLINNSLLVNLSLFLYADQSAIIIWIQSNSVIDIELSKKDSMLQLSKFILKLNNCLNFLIHLTEELLFKVSLIVIFADEQSDLLHYLFRLSNSWLIVLKKVNEVNKCLTQSFIAELNDVLLLIDLNWASDFFNEHSQYVLIILLYTDVSHQLKQFYLCIQKAVLLSQSFITEV